MTGLRHVCRRVVAGALGLAAGCVLTIYLSSLLEWRSYVSYIGSYHRVALRDGSSAELNTDTSIDTRIDTHSRTIILKKGEARFVVARDASRPFEVRVADLIVRARGTIFTVRLSEQNAVIVTVEEGSVELLQGGSSNTNWLLSRRSRPAPDRAILTAGDVISITALGSATLSQASPEEIARQGSWRSGELQFEGAALRDIVEEVNRFNERKLIIVDPKLADYLFSGSFRTTDPHAFLYKLNEVVKVRSQLELDESGREVMKIYLQDDAAIPK